MALTDEEKLLIANLIRDETQKMGERIEQRLSDTLGEFQRFVVERTSGIDPEALNETLSAYVADFWLGGVASQWERFLAESDDDGVYDFETEERKPKVRKKEEE